jgi:hypothetical protein
MYKFNENSVKLLHSKQAMSMMAEAVSTSEKWPVTTREHGPACQKRIMFVP